MLGVPFPGSWEQTRKGGMREREYRSDFFGDRSREKNETDLLVSLFFPFHFSLAFAASQLSTLVLPYRYFPHHPLSPATLRYKPSNFPITYPFTLRFSLQTKQRRILLW